MNAAAQRAATASTAVGTYDESWEACDAGHVKTPAERRWPVGPQRARRRRGGEEVTPGRVAPSDESSTEDHATTCKKAVILQEHFTLRSCTIPVKSAEPQRCFVTDDECCATVIARDRVQVLGHFKQASR